MFLYGITSGRGRIPTGHRQLITGHSHRRCRRRDELLPSLVRGCYPYTGAPAVHEGRFGAFSGTCYGVISSALNEAVIGL